MKIDDLIRTVPDYPKPGIVFFDITTLLKDAKGFKQAIKKLSTLCSTLKIDKVAGIEARGFIFGSAVAFELGLGFIPIRKKGKLPAKTIGCTYDLDMVLIVSNFMKMRLFMVKEFYW